MLKPACRTNLAIICLVAFLHLIAARDTILDDFLDTELPGLRRPDGPFEVTTTAVVGTIFGGERDMRLLPSMGTRPVTAMVRTGDLFFENGARTAGAIEIVYDGADGDALNDAEGLNADLFNNGDAFLVVVRANDLAVTFDFDVTTIAEGLIQSSTRLEMVAPGIAEVIIPFVPNLITAYRNVTQLVFRVDMDPEVDVTISQFCVVPTIEALLFTDVISDTAPTGPSVGDLLLVEVVVFNPISVPNLGVDDVAFFHPPFDTSIAVLETGSVITSKGEIKLGNAPSDDQIWIAIGPMADGEDVTITFHLRLIAPGQLSLQGELFTTPFDSVPVLTSSFNREGDLRCTCPNATIVDVVEIDQCVISERFSADDLNRRGTWILENHPRGDLAPPEYCLRLDALPLFPTDMQVVFSCEDNNLLISYDGIDTIRIFGTVRGFPINDPSNFAKYEVDFTYRFVRRVPSTGIATAVENPNERISRGTIKVSSTGQEFELTVARSSPPSRAFVIERQLGSDPGFTLTGWLEVDGLSSQAPNFDDWIAIIGPCVAPVLVTSKKS